MNVLIDTCIIIDALQSREPFNKDAEAVFLSVANRRCVGFLTANSVTDIYYLMHKALHSSEKTKKVLGVLAEWLSALQSINDDTGVNQNIHTLSNRSLCACSTVMSPGIIPNNDFAMSTLS